jgi:hypothetical protein
MPQTKTYRVAFNVITAYETEVEAESQEEAERRIVAMLYVGTLKKNLIGDDGFLDIQNIEQIEPESSPPPASPASSRKRSATKSATPRAR